MSTTESATAINSFLAVSDAHEQPATSTRAAIVQDLLLVVGLFLFMVWRLALTLITYLGTQIIPLEVNGGPGSGFDGSGFDYWTSWAQWDGAQFQHISDHGYHLPRSAAFFPMFPMVVRGVNYLVGNTFLTGVVIANVALISFLFVFHRLVKERFGSTVARLTLITFMTFPSTYFATAFYSESLFLLLTALSLWCLTRDRLLYGAGFAGLAASTRFVGVACWLPLALYALRRWDWSGRWLARSLQAAALAVLPFGAYCLYLWLDFGDPLHFLHAASDWNRTPEAPWPTFLTYLAETGGIYIMFEVGSALLFLYVLARGRHLIPLEWWLCSLVILLIPMSSGNFVSMTRYVLCAFGVFVIAAQHLETRHIARAIIWSTGAVLQGFLATLFIGGYWTA